MRPRFRPPLCLALLVCLLAPEPGQAQRREKPQDRDLERLTVAKIPTDTPELLAFLRSQVPADEALGELRALREKLGAANFREREDASKALATKNWHAYVLLLSEGLTAGPPEARRRARECMDLIRQSGALREMSIPPVVARVLEKRRTVEAIDPLFALLPWIVDEDAAEEFWYTLDSLVRTKRSLPVVCVGGLTAPDAQRRAAAGFLIARYGDRVERTLAARLLADPDAEVRLRTAQGFLGAADVGAIPPLIALLDGPSTFIAWQAEELLIWMADGKAPKPVIGPGDAAAKKECREAWQTWWAATRATYTLGHLVKKAEPPGLYLISARRRNSDPSGAQLVTGSDSVRYRWIISRGGPSFVEQFLPNDRRLVSFGVKTRNGATYGVTSVSECSDAGHLLWNCTLPRGYFSKGFFPDVCRRIGGHWTVAGDRQCLILFDDRGYVVWKREREAPRIGIRTQIDPGIYGRGGGSTRQVWSTDEDLHPVAVQDGIVVCLVPERQYVGLDVWTGKEIVYYDEFPGSDRRLTLPNGNVLGLVDRGRLIEERKPSGHARCQKPVVEVDGLLSLLSPLVRLGFDGNEN